jgi:hypothetical protein
MTRGPLPGAWLFGRPVQTAFMRPAVIMTVLGALALPAAAKTEVRGQPHAVELVAEDAMVGEVLAALSAAFPLTYKPGPGLEHRVTGTYSGTLQRVLGRILEGYDHVIRDSADGLEIVALRARASGARALSAATPDPPWVAPNASAARPAAGPSPASVNSPTAGW